MYVNARAIIVCRGEGTNKVAFNVVSVSCFFIEFFSSCGQPLSRGKEIIWKYIHIKERNQIMGIFNCTMGRPEQNFYRKRRTENTTDVSSCEYLIKQYPLSCDFRSNFVCWEGYLAVSISADVFTLFIFKI